MTNPEQIEVTDLSKVVGGYFYGHDIIADAEVPLWPTPELRDRVMKSLESKPSRRMPRSR